MKEGTTYWDSGMCCYATVIDSRPGATTIRPATHAEIKALVDREGVEPPTEQPSS